MLRTQMKPSLQDVVREKGIQEFKQTKRSVRLEKKTGCLKSGPGIQNEVMIGIH